jgi:outer membrane protein OmpA-like peptidoglycan-associated protein
VAVGPAAALGVLALVAAAGLKPGPRALATQPAWLERLDDQIARGAYGWVRVGYARPVAILSGEAASAQLRDAALASLEQEMKRDPEAAQDVALVVDAIAVRNGPPAVGAALLALPVEPDAPACQRAFDETLAGRTIGFEAGMASLSGGSARLLDAVAGVAMRCAAFAISIEGHTDTRGAGAGNLVLSRRRADTVRAYLVDRGAPPAALTAIGYGETRPLDRAADGRAHARNRRIAFTVKPGPSSH